MRARKKTWAKQEFEINRHLIEKPEEINNWQKVFGNDNPLHLEIGCGKGRFITENAKTNENINYIGLEREEMVIITGMRKAREESINNVRFILGDVSDISSFFGEGVLSRIYINFCDPWPNKKKWAKRRLTHGSFLKKYKSLFKNNSAEIFFKTDNMELFEFSIEQFSEEGFVLKNVSLNLHESKFEGNIKTEYEEKFSSKGMPIYRLEAYIDNTVK